MKQVMKQWVILAADMTLCGTMVLTSCSGGDDAALVTDNRLGIARGCHPLADAPFRDASEKPRLYWYHQGQENLHHRRYHQGIGLFHPQHGRFGGCTTACRGKTITPYPTVPTIP